jgi:2-methylcitrate dehydratase PrpD
LLRIVLGDPKRFEFLRKEKIAKSCGVGGEAIAVADFGSLLGAVNLVDPVASVVAAVIVAGNVGARVASASVVAAATASFAAAVGGTTAAAAAAATAMDTMRWSPTKAQERLGIGWFSLWTRLRPPSSGVWLRQVASWFAGGVTRLLNRMK